MITGPKYKIARRVGAPIFEKTQTRKYAERLERRGKTKGFSKPKSEFAIQLNEKQKARFIYGLTERQFSNYVKEALGKKSSQATTVIFEFLETRLDNVVYRLGLAPTRRAARQMISHGHIRVNGIRSNTPSRRMTATDIITIREGSQSSPLFTGLKENPVTPASWLRFDVEKKTAQMIGKPEFNQGDSMFDLNAVVEFYSR